MSKNFVYSKKENLKPQKKKKRVYSTHSKIIPYIYYDITHETRFWGYYKFCDITCIKNDIHKLKIKHISSSVR